jgi:hypothetical protein
MSRAIHLTLHRRVSVYPLRLASKEHPPLNPAQTDHLLYYGAHPDNLATTSKLICSSILSSSHLYKISEWASFTEGWL